MAWWTQPDPAYNKQIIAMNKIIGYLVCWSLCHREYQLVQGFSMAEMKICFDRLILLADNCKQKLPVCVIVYSYKQSSGNEVNVFCYLSAIIMSWFLKEYGQIQINWNKSHFRIDHQFLRNKVVFQDFFPEFIFKTIFISFLSGNISIHK